MSRFLDFSCRSTESEWMDAALGDPAALAACLGDLSRVNRATRAYAPTLRFLDRALPALRRLGRPVQLLDVGSGYGDTLREVARWARKRQLPLVCTGVDPNPVATRAAAASTPAGHEIRWVTADVFGFRPAEGVDVVISSLVTHHLSDAEIAALLRWMEAKARVGWFVSDLHRHPVPYHFFRWASWLARLHPFVQHDGPVSIARAFVREDWEHLLAAADIHPDHALVRWELPFRLTVSRLRAA